MSNVGAMPRNGLFFCWCGAHCCTLEDYCPTCGSALPPVDDQYWDEEHDDWEPNDLKREVE